MKDIEPGDSTHHFDSKTCSCVIEDVDLEALATDLSFLLKWKQKETFGLLFTGKDVISVLPTSFGQNLTFQLFVWAKTRSLSSLNAFVRTADNHKIIVNHPLIKKSLCYCFCEAAF